MLSELRCAAAWTGVALISVLTAAAPTRSRADDSAACSVAPVPVHRSIAEGRERLHAVAADLEAALRHVSPASLRAQLALICPVVPLAPGYAVPGGFLEGARRRAAALRACRPATLAKLGSMTSPELARLVSEAIAVMDLTDPEAARLATLADERLARLPSDDEDDDAPGELEMEGIELLGRHQMVLGATARLQLHLWTAGDPVQEERAWDAFERLRHSLHQAECRAALPCQR